MTGLHDRSVDRDRRVRAAETLDRRLQLGPHVILVIAVEQRADQAAPDVAGAHHPVGDREREVHVAGHHDTEIVVREVMAADGVDERRVAHEPVVAHVAAIVEALVDQILPHHRNHQNVARVRVEHGAERDRKRRPDRHESEQRAPREKDDAPFPGGGDAHLAVGKVLVMLARVPVVDRAQGPHVDQPVITPGLRGFSHTMQSSANNTTPSLMACRKLFG